MRTALGIPVPAITLLTAVALATPDPKPPTTRSGGRAPALSPLYAPLFQKGHRFTYQVRRTARSGDAPSGGRTGRFRVTCTVAAVRSFTLGLASDIRCTKSTESMDLKGFPYTGCSASARGFSFGAPKTEAEFKKELSEGEPTLPADPQESMKREKDEDGVWIRRVFRRQVRLGHRRVDAWCAGRELQGPDSSR
jgi:hypothetical protein